jgi:hypothetical protein
VLVIVSEAVNLLVVTTAGDVDDVSEEKSQIELRKCVKQRTSRGNAGYMFSEAREHVFSPMDVTVVHYGMKRMAS